MVVGMKEDGLVILIVALILFIIFVLVLLYIYLKGKYNTRHLSDDYEDALEDDDD